MSFNPDLQHKLKDTTTSSSLVVKKRKLYGLSTTLPPHILIHPITIHLFRSLSPFLSHVKHTVNVRTRDNVVHGVSPVEEVIASLKEEIRSKALTDPKAEAKEKEDSA